MNAFISLLRENRNYRNMWVGQVVSEIGDHFNNIAVFSLAVAVTRSGLVVSGVLLARAIPAMQSARGTASKAAGHFLLDACIISLLLSVRRSPKAIESRIYDSQSKTGRAARSFTRYPRPFGNCGWLSTV